MQVEQIRDKWLQMGLDIIHDLGDFEVTPESVIIYWFSALQENSVRLYHWNCKSYKEQPKWPQMSLDILHDLGSLKVRPESAIHTSEIRSFC